MRASNKITGANAGGPPWLAGRARWAARMAQFRVSKNRDGMSNSGEELTYLCGGEIDAGQFSLCIWSETLEPESISQLLRIQPTEHYRRGDPMPSGKLHFNHGSWEFSTGKLDFRVDRSCEERFDDFMRSLPESPEIWSRITAEHETRVCIVLWMRTWNREFDLSPFALGELAKRRLRLHIDTYLETKGEERPNCSHLGAGDAGLRLRVFPESRVRRA